MMNANIWIKDPYVFRTDEWLALEESLQSMYGRSLVYMREWPVDRVSIDNTTKTDCMMIAATLRTIHRHYAILDKKYRGSAYCKELDVVIQGPEDEKPAWAKKEVSNG
jgi:hypothetical protein